MPILLLRGRYGGGVEAPGPCLSSGPPEPAGVCHRVLAPGRSTENVAVGRNGFVERPVGLGNLVVLLAAIWLSLATWACFTGRPGMPAWKPWLSVALAVILALGSLTRNRAWGLRLRAAAGVWVLTAPL